MSSDREFRFRTFIEVGVVVEIDAETEDAEFEAKGLAEQKAQQIVDALNTIFSVVGDSFELQVTDMTEIQEYDED